MTARPSPLLLLLAAAALALGTPAAALAEAETPSGPAARAAMAVDAGVPAVGEALPAHAPPLLAAVDPNVAVTAEVVPGAGVAVDASAGLSGDAAVVRVGPLPVATLPQGHDVPASPFAPSAWAEKAAPYAAPAAGSAVAIGLGALLWRALAALLPSMPLFSRIERGDVLQNPVRARIHEAVQQDPGLSLTELADRAGVAWGTAVHHLRRLEDTGLLVSTNGGGHRRFFAANTPAAAQRSAVAVVLHPTARRIAELVAQRPGIDQAGICDALRLNNPAASKHLGRFERHGLVLSQRSGRSRHYQATGGLHSALVLLDPPNAQAPAQALGFALASRVAA